MELDYKIQDVKTTDVTEFFFERSNYDENSLKELSDNIIESGQVNEIVLRTIGSNGTFQIIAGSRRFKALEMAKIKSFQAKVYLNMSDIEALDICLSENIHTRDISGIDISKLLKQWIDSGTKQADIAKKLGKSAGWVSKQLKLLDTDIITQDAIAAGNITAEHARVIEVLPNAKDRESMVMKATEGDLSVTATKDQVDKKLSRIDISDKIDKLESVIIEYEQKIIDADNATSQIEEFEKRLSELDIDRKSVV